MPIKQAEPAVFRVAVAGNYADTAAATIRAKLTQKLMYVKNRVHDPVEVLMPEHPTPISALAGRVARSLRLATRVTNELDSEDFRNSVNLVVLVRVEAGEGTPEEVAADLDEDYSNQSDPWSGNERQYEMAVGAGKLLRTPRFDNLSDAKLPAPPETQPLSYTEFKSEIDQWTEKNVREGEPTHDRNEIPEYGPDITPDGDMAGGLQQS